MVSSPQIIILKLVCISHFFRVQFIPCPIHHDLITLIIFREEYKLESAYSVIL
jgi:hypothetical protein